MSEVKPVCTFSGGCVNRIRALDLCDAHYRQQARGEALRPLRRRSPNKNPYPKKKTVEKPTQDVLGSPVRDKRSRPIRVGVPEIPYEPPLPVEVLKMARDKMIAHGADDRILEVLGLDKIPDV